MGDIIKRECKSVEPFFSIIPVVDDFNESNHQKTIKIVTYSRSLVFYVDEYNEIKENWWQYTNYNIKINSISQVKSFKQRYFKWWLVLLMELTQTDGMQQSVMKNKCWYFWCSILNYSSVSGVLSKVLNFILLLLIYTN